MSVLSVTLLKSRHASINEKFERQYTLTYDVLMTSPHDGGLLAMSAVGWAVGNDYSTSTEFDTLAKVKQIGSDCESDDGKRWKVTVEFGKIDPQQQENPLAVPIILEWGSAQYEYEATQDVNGKPIANKAGDPIPGEKKEASRPI